MIKPHARCLTQGDIEIVAANMRRADVDEIRASSGLSPHEALRESVRLSSILRVGATDSPFCIFGVAPSPLANTGFVWLLGTDKLTEHRREFLKQSREILDSFHDSFSLLCNCVDERNEVHIRWLRWCGARFIKRHPHYGHEGRPFLEFIHVRCSIGRSADCLSR